MLPRLAPNMASHWQTQTQLRGIMVITECLQNSSRIFLGVGQFLIHPHYYLFNGMVVFLPAGNELAGNRIIYDIENSGEKRRL